MDPNLQQLLWAAYPLACFWLGILCRSDFEAMYGPLGGLLFFLAIAGHLAAFGFIGYACLRAFHIVP